MADGRMLTFLACVVLFAAVSAAPEPGIWTKDFDKNQQYMHFAKSMYKDTIITVQIHCKASDEARIKVGWVLRYSPCTDEYTDISDDSEKGKQILDNYYNAPRVQLYPEVYKYRHMEFIQSPLEMDVCSEIVALQDHVGANVTIAEAIIYNDTASDEDTPSASKTAKTGAGQGAIDENPPAEKVPTVGSIPLLSTLSPSTTKGKQRKKRDDAPSEPATNTAPAQVAQTQTGNKDHKYRVAKAWKDGTYIFVLHIEAEDGSSPVGTVTVTMQGPYGYISAMEWPLLIFYGIMGLVYIIFGLIWLVMLACNWRDLLRVQYWVGGVIVLGMLEKAVFYAEYQSIATSGTSVTEGAVIFAELLSCLKRALARMLVIIVSLGFGIVKPRLGPTLQKVLFVGGLYFIAGSVEGCMRALKRIGDQSNDVMLAAIPLALIDASICWWIFTSLIQTTRTLRLRRNVVKLTLYRHFTNTLIFAVIASIIFMIWAIVQHKMKACITNWRELWIDDAFWHLLFSVILLIIMILWRPSTNNQRYAFTPLLDAADDEDEEDETIMNDAFEGMKMRPKSQANGSPKQKDKNNIEDDLKWVEENIPTSITDKVLPSMLDSDEEIMTAKYEMSKMQ